MTPKHSLYHAESVLTKKNNPPYFCWEDYASLDKNSNIIMIKGVEDLSQQFELPNPDNFNCLFTPKGYKGKNLNWYEPQVILLACEKPLKERLILGQHLNPETQLLMIQK